MTLEIIEKTTTELREFLDDYLGKKEYGNLRFGHDHSFPGGTIGCISWGVVYEHSGTSSSAIMILYRIRSDTWKNRLEEIYPSQEAAINYFKNKILQIPRERKKYDS